MVPLLVESNIPNNNLVMRNSARIDYLIRNLTKDVVEINVTVERPDNDYLMFDGFSAVSSFLYTKYLSTIEEDRIIIGTFSKLPSHSCCFKSWKRALSAFKNSM
jgi:hypothetical protein